MRGPSVMLVSYSREGPSGRNPPQSSRAHVPDAPSATAGLRASPLTAVTSRVALSVSSRSRFGAQLLVLLLGRVAHHRFDVALLRRF